MNVSLGKKLESFIRERVESGDYASASEVVRDSLRLLKEKAFLKEARLQLLRGEIEIGINQAEKGDLLQGEEVMDELLTHIKNKK